MQFELVPLKSRSSTRPFGAERLVLRSSRENESRMGTLKKRIGKLLGKERRPHLPRLAAFGSSTSAAREFKVSRTAQSAIKMESQHSRAGGKVSMQLECCT